MRNTQPGRSRDGWLAGLLLALAPVPPVLHAVVTDMPPSSWRWAPIGTASAFLFIAALLLLVTKSGARLLATAGVLLTVGTFAVQLLARPGPAFFVGILVMAILARLWSDPPIDDPRPDALSLAKGALLPAVLVWFVAGPGAIVTDPISVACALATAALTALFVLIALVTGAVRPPAIYFAVPLTLLVLAAGLIRFEPNDALAAAPLLVLLLILFVRERDTMRAQESFWEQLLANPAPLLVATFLTLGMTGTILLWIPVSTTSIDGIALIDAAFTAISASCVTGLIVLDTPVVFTRFGQGAILFLIQVGGLGIMTFSTAALALLRRRASLKHERALADLLGAEGRLETMRAVRDILIVTATVEIAGAIVLALAFARLGDETGMAIWRGVFTSISAFCNAGFALQSTNLMPYANDPVVISTAGLLVVLGGLGPPIVVAMPSLLRRQPPSLHQYLVLLTTAFLLAAPAVVITAIEWNASLKDLDFAARIYNGFFQTAITRTAGFNSIDPSTLHPATQIIMMMLMFIGGAPGSTAGGIKVTTFAILVLAILTVLRGGSSSVVHHRRIPHQTIYKATAVTGCGLLIISIISFALLLTQDIEPLPVLFEVVSAVGTVGLSVGATAELDAVGKLLIIFGMFAGRVGPLTLLLLLRESEAGARWTFPEEQVPVG